MKNNQVDVRMNLPAAASSAGPEERIKNLEPDELRPFVLAKAKDFKTSWISLGQALFSIYQDKIYRQWGYQHFETYVIKEIGIRKDTGLALVRSYGFLEKEEPQYLDKQYVENREPAHVPTPEAVNILRMVKDKKDVFTPQDYERFKSDILEKGRDAREVKKDLTQMMRQRQEIDPEEARQKERRSTITRMVSALKTLKRDIETLKLLPAELIKDADHLIAKIEAEL